MPSNRLALPGHDGQRRRAFAPGLFVVPGVLARGVEAVVGHLEQLDHVGAVIGGAGHSPAEARGIEALGAAHELEDGVGRRHGQ